MAAPSTSVTFWGFIWYLRNNRFRTVEALTEQDLIAAATLFAATNADAVTDAADPGTYTDLEWPGGITAVQTRHSCDQALYPEKPV